MNRSFVLLLITYSWITMDVQGSALHGPCEGDEDCGTIDTVCKEAVCACTTNFTVWFDTCVPVLQPSQSCHKKNDCQRQFGSRSTCTQSVCACKPFHHLHQGQCVKNRDLHETCDHDHQCYCGHDCQTRIACIHQTCACRVGHSPYKSRRCIADPVVVTTTVFQQQKLSSSISSSSIVNINKILCVSMIIFLL